MTLKKLVQFTAVDVLLLGALVSLAGCESKGPAEQAGRRSTKAFKMPRTPSIHLGLWKKRGVRLTRLPTSKAAKTRRGNTRAR